MTVLSRRYIEEMPTEFVLRRRFSAFAHWIRPRSRRRRSVTRHLYEVPFVIGLLPVLSIVLAGSTVLLASGPARSRSVHSRGSSDPARSREHGRGIRGWDSTGYRRHLRLLVD